MPDHWWFLFFPLFWLLVFACLFRFLIFRRGWGWGRGCGPRGDRPGPERAEGILAERYARGEIGDDEHRTRLERLRADAQA